MQRHYSLGGVWMIPSGANPTPVQLGILKDASLDFDREKKPLEGAFDVPVDVANGPLKIGLKAKFQEVNAALFSAIVGGSSAGGTVLPAAGEAATIPGNPYAVTVTNSANWVDDLGVANLTTGKYMTRVASGATPATGEYKVTAGVYTFAAADTTNQVSISYSYSAAGTGKTVTLTNALLGASTPYIVTAYNVYGGKPVGVKFWAAHAKKLGLALKATDWLDEDVEFLIAADSTNRIATIYTGE